MPYKDKGKNRAWHREKMRATRLKSKLLHPTVTPKKDADGYPIYEE